LIKLEIVTQRTFNPLNSEVPFISSKYKTFFLFYASFWSKNNTFFFS